MSEWRTVPISEACSLIVDCVNKTAPIADGETPYRMVRTTNIRGGRIDLTDSKCVTEETFLTWTRRSRVEVGDVLLTREAPIGEVGYVANQTPIFLGQRIVQYRANPEVLEPRFLLYAFLSPGLQAQFRAFEGSGSVVSHIRVGDCYKFEIPLPTLQEQRVIAHILGTLDDKIELNRRMNETLEAMARAIFQSWFVDFDPVHAKTSGESADSICQRLGLTPELLALFPDSFDESVLGVVPTGWIVESIGTLANVTGGSTPNTKEPKYWDDGVHYWATPKDLSRLSSPVLLGTERKVSDEGLAQIGSGLLKPGTVLLSSRAPIGYRAINEVPVAVNQGFIAMAPNSGVSKYFLLYWAEWAHDEIVSRANGSTFLEISKANFRPIPVVRPTDDLFEKFDQYIGPLYKRIVSNEQETQLLVAQRDSLLPKLLSGEVPVAAEEGVS